MHQTLASQRHQSDPLGLPRLKTHRLAGRDVEAPAKAGGAIQHQGSVDLKKVKVTSSPAKP